MAEIKLNKRYKYAGDIFQKLVDVGLDIEAATAFLNEVEDADVEENKDCKKCIHFDKHVTEYPCSHCRNCHTDKFQPNDTRTPKERGGEK